jgi:hypothetical protein
LTCLPASSQHASRQPARKSPRIDACARFIASVFFNTLRSLFKRRFLRLACVQTPCSTSPCFHRPGTPLVLRFSLQIYTRANTSIRTRGQLLMPSVAFFALISVPAPMVAASFFAHPQVEELILCTSSSESERARILALRDEDALDVVNSLQRVSSFCCLAFPLWRMLTLPALSISGLTLRPE